ncbi:hypothetical protein RhiirC2_770517 [Rhizophagus irregularis]|uniref:Uncharacterized protein n=1 Tax=Rhizophagus irregularis TaxID=588596 RepID=A0A2N1NW91_9GLOM|nr:hypothetical protein RhiirC2_770517 [Rhizophagus irregularis]
MDLLRDKYQLGPKYVTLTEDENNQLESDLAAVKGRPIIRPGRSAILQLPPQDPKPKLSLVTTVNIVVKFLNPKKYPVLTRHTTQMLKDLNDAGLLNDVVGFYIKARVREFKNGEIRLSPSVDIYDIVPKGSYMYALVLPKGQYLMLRHLREECFKLQASRHIVHNNIILALLITRMNPNNF